MAFRLVVVGLLIPLFVPSIFRGADVFIHGHQGESAHLHLSPLGVEGGAGVAASAHDEAHGHSHHHGAPGDHHDESPLGVQVTIQDHEQLPSRKADLVPELRLSDPNLAIAQWTSALLSIVDPDCPERPPATNFVAVRPSTRFGDRLARTSNAFLI